MFPRCSPLFHCITGKGKRTAEPHRLVHAHLGVGCLRSITTDVTMSVVGAWPKFHYRPSRGIITMPWRRPRVARLLEEATGRRCVASREQALKPARIYGVHCRNCRQRQRLWRFSLTTISFIASRQARPTETGGSICFTSGVKLVPMYENKMNGSCYVYTSVILIFQ